MIQGPFQQSYQHLKIPTQSVIENSTCCFSTGANFHTTASLGITIEVSNAKLVHKLLDNYVIYTIKGSDKVGQFQVSRRYKDFIKIKTVLISRWPGIYIPPLPPKSIIDNMDSKFLEDRRMWLNEFCNQVSSQSFLHFSEEYQGFIRSPKDFECMLTNFKKPRTQDIIQTYMITFKLDMGDKLLSKSIIAKINQFKRLLIKIRDLFLNQKNKSCDDLDFGSRRDHEFGHSEMNVVFFDNFLDFLREEIKQIEAAIEAVSVRDEYEKKIAKMHKKQKDMVYAYSEEKEYEDRSIVKIFEKQISEIEEKIAAQKRLHDMVAIVLAYNEIERFKDRKMAGYYKAVQFAAGKEMKTYKDAESYYQALLSCPLFN